MGFYGLVVEFNFGRTRKVTWGSILTPCRKILKTAEKIEVWTKMRKMGFRAYDSKGVDKNGQNATWNSFNTCGKMISDVHHIDPSRQDHELCPPELATKSSLSVAEPSVVTHRGCGVPSLLSTETTVHSKPSATISRRRLSKALGRARSMS